MRFATFVRVVRQGSLARAARILAVPKSTVSRRLNRLETALEVKLLYRGPQTQTDRRGRAFFSTAFHSSIDQVERAIHGALRKRHASARQHSYYRPR